MYRTDTEQAVFMEVQETELGLADAHRVSQHGLEYRRQLARRRADDAEHIRRRGLLLQRLVQFAGEPRDLRFMASNG